MKPFNKETLIRLLDEDESLNRIAESIAESVEVDQSLKEIFDKYVVPYPQRMQRYEALFGTAWSQIPDTPLVAEVRRLVNQYGWREFVKAVAQFAFKKLDQMKQLGLTSNVAAWTAAYEKLRMVRKNVQL